LLVNNNNNSVFKCFCCCSFEDSWKWSVLWSVPSTEGLDQ